MHTVKIEGEIDIHNFVFFKSQLPHFYIQGLRINFSQVIIEATNACRNLETKEIYKYTHT